jgi:hypothetical protein
MRTKCQSTPSTLQLSPHISADATAYPIKRCTLQRVVPVQVLLYYRAYTHYRGCTFADAASANSQSESAYLAIGTYCCSIWDRELATPLPALLLLLLLLLPARLVLLPPLLPPAAAAAAAAAALDDDDEPPPRGLCSLALLQL